MESNKTTDRESLVGHCASVCLGWRGKSEGEEREGCESLGKMFVHTVTGSVSLNRDRHMQHGGMSLAFHFPMKAAPATCAHSCVCVCVHVERCAPPFPSSSNPYGIVFHYPLIAMILSFHPPSHQVSPAVSCEHAAHVHQRGCARWVLCCKTAHG